MRVEAPNHFVKTYKEATLKLHWTNIQNSISAAMHRISHRDISKLPVQQFWTEFESHIAVQREYIKTSKTTTSERSKTTNNNLSFICLVQHIWTMAYFRYKFHLEITQILTVGQFRYTSVPKWNSNNEKWGYLRLHTMVVKTPVVWQCT